MSADMVQAFELMALGMGGDFFVLFVIYVVSKLLLKLLPPEKE
ncbi:OadG-related small transporter subunit [Lacticaseibacillus baoqingensis]|uniref:OadG-related small transporter subunit n=1 Tax=Lacticaseibacillus baoqingensis TaxID=2486013 RepID=A0ABW4E8J9_9LACO